MRFFKRNINLTHHFRQLVNLIVLIIKRLEKKISRTHDGRKILGNLQKKLLSKGLSHKLPSRHQRPEFRSAKVSTSRLKRIKDT